MRETRSWRSSAKRSLQKQANLPKDQIEALLDVELCLFAIEKLGLQSELYTATSVWLLISNRFYLFPPLTSLVETAEAKRTLFNLRQLLPYLTNQDVAEQLVKGYSQIPSKYRAYDIDNSYRFSRKSMPSIWGNRFECFEDLLSNKLKYRSRNIKYAEPGKEYRFRSEENTYSVRIPLDFPVYQGKILSLYRNNIKAIALTRSEMESAADLLDRCSGSSYRKGLLQNTILEHPQAMGFAATDTIVFDGMKNLVGLLNAGKSTAIEFFSVALVKKGHRVGIVFNEVVTCLRMASLLKKAGLRVSVAIGQRNRKVHLENWHNVDGGLDSFEHLSTACPLSSYFHPTYPSSPPCFDLREVRQEDDGSDREDGAKICPLIGQCPRHRDTNELANADVILTTAASAIFTRPLPHVSPQSITYYELMYRTCSVVFFDECDKVQTNLDSTFLPAIKLIEKGSNGFLDRVVTWTRSQKLGSSRNNLRQVTFGQFNHALGNADALVDNICTQLQLSPNESEWLAEHFFTCSSLARDFVIAIAKAERIDTDSNTFILDKNPVYQELAEFLLGDWKSSWLAEYAMRLKSENYQEQQETIAKIEKELTAKGWLKAIKDKWGFSCKFALFLKLVLFVSFFQQAIVTAYGLSEQADGADEVVFFNRIPRDFYGLIPGLASGLVCGFKLEQQQNQLTLWYFQALGQGRWLLENFSNVFADEGTQGAHTLLLSGTSWAGLSPASVSVYLIPYYNGEKTKYLPVAVRMDRTGVTAKAYGCNDWLDFHTLQVKMASGAKEFSAIELDRSKIQSWVFNNLFQETIQPTIYCFKASNLRTRGPAFLQKQFWQKHLLAWNTDETTTFIPISKYPNVRVANIITPDTTEVPIYRVCGEDDELEGHTAGVFYPSSQNAECGYYYLSNQRPESRSGGILNESKLVSLTTTKGDNKGQPKKRKPSSAQGYNPRGIFLNLTLQEGDCFSDWANFVQCLRLYGLIHYLGATTLPAPLHLAAGLEDYRPIQAIREP